MHLPVKNWLSYGKELDVLQIPMFLGHESYFSRSLRSVPLKIITSHWLNWSWMAVQWNFIQKSNNILQSKNEISLHPWSQIASGLIVAKLYFITLVRISIFLFSKRNIS